MERPSRYRPLAPARSTYLPDSAAAETLSPGSIANTPPACTANEQRDPSRSTVGVAAMPAEQCRSLLHRVRDFDAFDEDNDPHGERDLGAVEVDGVRYFWKLDYFDREMETLSLCRPGGDDPRPHGHAR